jgi:tetrahydromethanopterin S-methyltransferase subunit C
MTMIEEFLAATVCTIAGSIAVVCIITGAIITFPFRRKLYINPGSYGDMALAATTGGMFWLVFLLVGVAAVVILDVST